MPNLSTYDQLVWKEGLEKGRVEGLAQGRVEGQVEGLAKGRVSGLQEALMDLSKLRFGPSALLLRQRIKGIQDQTELRRLTRCIVSASSVEDFVNQLPPG